MCFVILLIIHKLVLIFTQYFVSGNKAFFDVDWSPLNNSILAASADRHIRLYDPRSTGTFICDYYSVIRIDFTLIYDIIYRYVFMHK